eukprot:TRINITY_DN7503_c0_g1_i1.p1 TRINITY_DN7503_c0_g1~~TRINITY_DN7503_c0_g1_i1.p1  ORF type:complete len:333 (-),score=70.68 TRINITY_DN7503_c0_g1_i1:79-1026(-)
MVVIATSLILMGLLATCDASGGDQAYLVYYADSNCNDNLAGLFPYQDGYQTTIYDASGGTCQELMACLHAPDSDQCTKDLNRGNKFDIEVQITDKDDGDVIEIFDGRSLAIGGDECNPSNLYDGCYFKYITGTQLNNDLSVLDSSSANSGAEDFGYLAYFDNNQCSQDGWAGARGFVDVETLELNGADSGNCYDDMPCLANSDSDACNKIDDGDREEVTLTNIKTNSAEKNFNGNTLTLESDECMQSRIFRNCWFRYVNQKTIAKDPNDFALADATTTQTSGTDTDFSFSGSGSLAATACAGTLGVGISLVMMLL